jgi:hypothetical protein
MTPCENDNCNNQGPTWSIYIIGRGEVEMCAECLEKREREGRDGET